MRRWNGWGDESVHYPLPASAADYLARVVGPGASLPDVSLEQALAAVPASRLPYHPLVSVEPLPRLLHARGQSLPDWIALRSGRIERFPDGVAFPDSADQVCALLEFARQAGVRLIPYGGGTSVVGHINPLPDAGPILTVDLSRMGRLVRFDPDSRLATFEAGVRGPALEAYLNARGFSLGHFPQSFELSTLGGWVASRSSGQQSIYYGRIEDLFAGGRLETFLGPLDLPVFPASAAGPDLKQLVLGSEGRLGILTHATVRVRPLPQTERFYGVFFRDWESGQAAVRAAVQAGLQVSMLRLSDPQETETTLVLSGRDNLVAWAHRGLEALGYRSERCLLIFGLTGARRSVAHTRRQLLEVCRRHGGLYTGETIGRLWRKSRFLTPYLRNSLWERGYALDTLETALPWSSVSPAAAAIRSAIQDEYSRLTGSAPRVLVFSHLSHIYPNGASIYVTYLFQRSADPQETLHRWQALKRAASLKIVEFKGTISHQHGVGLDHAPYLIHEKGRIGLSMLESVRRELDSQNLLNPGKLLA